MNNEFIIKCKNGKNLITVNKFTKGGKNEIIVYQKQIKAIIVNKYYVGKCKNCENTIGVQNSIKNKYILFENTCEFHWINNIKNNKTTI